MFQFKLVLSATALGGWKTMYPSEHLHSPTFLCGSACLSPAVETRILARSSSAVLSIEMLPMASLSQDAYINVPLDSSDVQHMSMPSSVAGVSVSLPSFSDSFSDPSALLSDSSQSMLIGSPSSHSTPTSTRSSASMALVLKGLLKSFISSTMNQDDLRTISANPIYGMNASSSFQEIEESPFYSSIYPSDSGGVENLTDDALEGNLTLVQDTDVTVVNINSSSQGTGARPKIRYF